MGERESRVASPFTAMTTAWTSFAESAVKGATAANRAAFAAFTPPVDVSSVATDDTTTSEDDEVVEPSVPSVVYEHADWTFERTVEKAADITVGDTVVFSKTLSEEDVRAFAAASGDTNRLHLDDEFAEDTRFGGRIAHGTLVSGLVSAALARLPGLTIYLSQELTFEGPVGIGDRVTATVEVLEDLGNGQYRLSTVIEDDERVVVDGEAVVLIDDLPE